mgnify:FL=1|jgi:hypothetical protein
MKSRPTEKQFEDALRSLLAPDPDGDIIDWLEKNVKNVPYSPQPGPFRIESTPYLAPILRALQDPEVETIVVQGNVQSGKSMVLELWSAFVPSRTPGPMLLLQDIDLNAQDWQQTRLRPLWENTPSTRERISDIDRNKWHTTQFQRNTTWVLGANNERNLQRRSIRFLGGDECWQWPKGHLKQAQARRTAFTWQGKSVFVSQGGVDADEFTELFHSTDRGEWSFKCVKCGTRQAFEWVQIKYPEAAKTAQGWNYDLLRAGCTYECKCCKHRYEDRNSVRAEMIKDAEYVSQNPSAPKGRRGFHFNAMTMLWGLSWGDLAVECVESAQSFDLGGDESKRKDFKQKRLALPWSDEPDDGSGEVLPSGYLMNVEWTEEGANYLGKLVAPPFDPLIVDTDKFSKLRFLCVDVQRKGFFCLVRSWSIDGKSRLILWEYVDTWEQVRELQIKNKVSPVFTFVDSGDGPNMEEVYKNCANYSWNATKGSGNTDFPWRVQTPYGIKVAYRPYSPAKVVQVGKHSCRVFQFSNLVLKDTLSRLRRAGHHTYAQDAGEEYRKQMQSEHRTRTESGKPIWVQIGERPNHLWDCETMGILPALMAKLIGRGKNKNATDEKAVDKAADSTIV